MNHTQRGEPSERDDDPDDVHVMPCYGKPHESSVLCWCEPVPDDEVPSLFVHRDMN